MWVVPIILERCKHILLIPDALVQHRIRKGSITRTYTIHNIHEYLTASRVLVKCIGKTEYSFSQKDIQLFRDNTLRVLVLRYAEIAKEVCAEEKEMLRNEITEIVKDYEFIDLKSKAVWWMFQYSPMLLYHLHSTYKMINSYFST